MDFTENKLINNSKTGVYTKNVINSFRLGFIFDLNGNQDLYRLPEFDI